MATKKRGLGKGLDVLLPGTKVNVHQSSQPGSAASVIEMSSQDRLKDLPLEYLQRGRYQPRTNMHPDTLEELAESIKVQGVMQPVVVRPLGENRYEIIAGERRWRACQKAGLETIPAVIRDVSDKAAIAMALIENIQREDLNPMEEAFALQRLQDEFDFTQQEVADAVGKSRSTVANFLRLMNLSENVKTLLERGDIEMGHARALLSLADHEQSKIAKVIVGKGLSVRQAEALVRKHQQEASTDQPTTHQINPEVKTLQDNLSEKLAAEVHIQCNAKGKGSISIKYNSLDELDGILEHIQ